MLKITKIRTRPNVDVAWDGWKSVLDQTEQTTYSISKVNQFANTNATVSEDGLTLTTVHYINDTLANFGTSLPARSKFLIDLEAWEALVGIKVIQEDITEV